MTQYNSMNAKLSNFQLIKLKSGIDYWSTFESLTKCDW